MLRVGSKVRSFDFPHSRECYVEGTIEGYKKIEGCEVEDPYDGHVFPPLNGTPKLFGGVCEGVEPIH